MKVKDQIYTGSAAELIKKARAAKFSESDIKDIERAIAFARKKHLGQFRKSGEPYIIHPIATAEILLSWKMDVKTIITGILHDVLEDTKTEEEEIKKVFGDDVLNLVKYVTKVSLLSKENRKDKSIKSEDEQQYIVQVFLSMSKDIRGMIVKLADRLHNMSTISHLKPQKQVQIATETLDIYSKVAGRLGMYRVKTNLQDLSFKVLNPQAYKSTADKIAKIVDTNSMQWKTILQQIEVILNSYSIEYEIKKRLKGVYSTWEKISKNYAVKEIHDIYAIRIIVNDNLDCYKVLGLIHLNFQFLRNTFKDYISNPKLNFYQSIHTTIVKNQSLLEIQIRTKEMDLVAENGIAAHWNYKENENDPHFAKKISNPFITEVSSLKNKTVENIKQITSDTVFDVLILNDGKKHVVNSRTRVIDLAYRYDSEKFKYLNTIIVNGQQVNFDTHLKHNDVIKISYSKEISITRKWLRFTRFSNTREGIKKILEQQYHYKLIDPNEFYNRLHEKLGSNYVGDKKVPVLIKKKLKITTLQDFLEFIPLEVYDNQHFIDCFNKHKSTARASFAWLIKNYGSLFNKKKEFYLNNIDGLFFRDLEFPDCCNKIPGMEVVGVLNKNGVFEVHNHDCQQLKKEKGKVYLLSWNQELLKKKPRKFRYKLNFEAGWTPSIGNIISKKIIHFHMVINELIVKKNKQNDTCSVSLILYASELEHVKFWFADLNQDIDIKTKLDF